LSELFPFKRDPENPDGRSKEFSILYKSKNQVIGGQHRERVLCAENSGQETGNLAD